MAKRQLDALGVKDGQGVESSRLAVGGDGLHHRKAGVIRMNKPPDAKCMNRGCGFSTLCRSRVGGRKQANMRVLGPVLGDHRNDFVAPGG